MPRAKQISFQTAFGRYESESVIGQGGAGTVYAARDEAGGPIAVKVLDPTKATKDRLKRFKNEYLFGFGNKHPHLLRVLDFGIVEIKEFSAPFYVSPRYRGSLRQLMVDGIPKRQVLPTFARILLGVEAAHLLKVTHRDLKPENILTNSLDDLVIGDFGIARFAEEELHTAVETKDSDRLANFAYAAPEQRKRGGSVDQRADIFALGLLLNELFTSEVAHGTEFKTVASVAPEYGWIDEVMIQMIRFDPAARPPTIAAVRELLRMKSDQFDAQQRISELSKKVVAVDELEDPLIFEPPQIIAADFDGRDLIITFDQSISPGWVEGLHNMGSFASAWGAGPDAFRFKGAQARVASDGQNAQQIITHLKNWLPRATAVYRQRAEASKRDEAERREAALRSQREELEKRERIRSSLKI